MPEEYPHLYVEFLYYFNEMRDYYECHEVLEELWLEEARNPFFQGLLQVAVALYHFRNGNVNGAIKLFRSALVKLKNFPDNCLGIRLGKLKCDTRSYLSQLEQYKSQSVTFYDLSIQIVDPKLQQLVRRTTTTDKKSDR